MGGVFVRRSSRRRSTASPSVSAAASIPNCSAHCPYLQLYTGVVTTNDSCAVCLNAFDQSSAAGAPYKLEHCTGHYLHLRCGEAALQVRPRCPTCLHIYDTITGDQPDGQMTVSYLPGTLPGCSCERVIVMSFVFSSGVQNEQHPSPGTPYSGTHRTGYLPDDDEGRSVLQLIQRAFKQRLMFTVGRSITTGRDNAVIWNGIHIKTSVSGGPAGYGYPDATYLERVRDELRIKGIF